MNNNSFAAFIKKNGKGLVVPTILVIMGLFMIFHPTGWMDVIVRVLGILFVIAGVLLGCSLFAVLSPFTMALAIALVVIGIICLALPGQLSDLILKVVGICMIINSIVSIHDAYVIKGKSDNFIKYIIVDILTLVIGIVLFFVPSDVKGVVGIVIGIILAVIGISNMITVFRVYRDGGRYVDDGTDVVWEEDVQK